MIYAHSELPPRQRSPRNDPSMLDGDSGHGNPGDSAGDLFAVDTDTDVGDARELDRLPGMIDEEDLPGVTRETLREFRELQEEVADSNQYSEDEAVDATVLSAEQDALGNKVEEPTGVVQPSAPAEEDEEPEAEPPAAGSPPLADYDSLTVKQINEQARDLSPKEVRRVLAFEQANRNRKSLVLQLERIASGRVRRRQEAASE